MIEKSEDTNLLSYMDGLYRYALVVTRNTATAADLVQETYLRAFATRQPLRPDGNAKGWLLTILRNIWLNQVRRTRTAREVIGLDPGDLDGVIEKSPDPHALCVRKNESERVRRAIDHLSRDFREIIILREYDGLSYQEIADLLECPKGTVMSRLARARARLRNLLSETETADRRQAGTVYSRIELPLGTKDLQTS
jgi:RNA polymerase sigma-70 factor, ECF subfamily